MKKFLIFLSVLVGVVSIGFGTYKVVQNKESFSFPSNIQYATVGEEFTIEYEWNQRRSKLKIDITDPSVLEYNASSGKFVAKKGGNSFVTYTLENSIDADNRNNSIQIFVGDGSTFNPFYIGTADQLKDIGNKELYTLDSSYKLINNIDLNTSLNTQYWLPIANNNSNGFTGSFDGNGYSIKNININKDLYNLTYEQNQTFTNVGLFAKVGELGFVANVKIDNLFIKGSSYTNIGAIAGVNNGTIERTEVRTATFAVENSQTMGGIVGLNERLEFNVGDDENYKRAEAPRVVRSSANVLMGAYLEVSTSGGELLITNGVGGVVGGLVGKNYGGTIVYAYSMGTVYLNDNATYYGGLVGVNEFKSLTEHNDYKYDHAGSYIKDTYASVILHNNSTSETTHTGGLVGLNKDRLITSEGTDGANKLIGNYYDLTKLTQNTSSNNALGVGVYELSGVVSEFNDKALTVVGLTSAALKNKSVYGSYKDNQDNIIPWDYNLVWIISSNNNNGYPYLNYANILVNDGIKQLIMGDTIDDMSHFVSNQFKLDGNYKIVGDLSFGDLEGVETWAPIGTSSRPFIGSVIGVSDENGKKPIIRDIIINGAEADNNSYGGFFGVLGSGSLIENITFENFQVNDYVNAGVIAGSNGLNNKAGGTISNVSIVGSVVTGTGSVGAIVGENYGTITKVTIEDFVGDFGITKGNTVKLLPGGNESNVGGLSGINKGNITNSLINGDIEITASQSDNENIVSYSANVGGVAGYNLGTILNTQVYAIKIGSEKGITSYVGGIAGVNEREISEVFAQSEISSDRTISSSYVGGLVGHLTGNGTLKNAIVKDAGLIGYKVGGAVGLFNYNHANYKTVFEFEKNGNLKFNNKNFIAVQGVAVHDVAITGEVIGGLINEFVNGIISDSYAITSQTGVSETSQKSGLIAVSSYTKSGSDVIAGVAQRVYNATTFHGNGKNHAVSKSDFLKEPTFEFLGTRTSGYIVNYLFDDEIDGNAAKPSSSFIVADILNSWFRFSKYAPSSTKEMKSSSKFIDFTFDGAVWEFGGGYPKIKALAMYY